MKYLRRTAEVEAVQFTKENLDVFLKFIFGENKEDEDVVFTDEMKEEIVNTGFGIKTSLGEQKINKNDWLVMEGKKPIVYSDREFKRTFMNTININ